MLIVSAVYPFRHLVFTRFLPSKAAYYSGSTVISVVLILMPALFIHGVALAQEGEDAQAIIEQIATSPDLPNTILISRKSSEGWLPPHFSLDGGAIWREFPSQPWNERDFLDMEVAIVPRLDGSVRFVVTVVDEEVTDVYRTGDLGATWAINQLFGGKSLELAISPAEPQKLYLFVSSWHDAPPGGWPSAGTSAYVSYDSGVTWEDFPLPLAHDMTYGNITPSPTESGRVYVFRDGYYPNWIRTDDGGSTWIEPGFQFPWGSLAIDPADSQILYALSTGWSYQHSGYSLDGGATWTNWENHPSDWGQLVAHPIRENALFLLNESLHRSLDRGVSWETIYPMSSGFIAPDYGNPERLLWANQDQIWSSEDDGESWQATTRTCPCIFLPIATGQLQD